MPTLNSSYISDIQTQNLSEKVETYKNTIDLKYDGYDRYEDIPFERKGMYSHANRVLLWLASKPNDYVRGNLRGGVLYSLIAQKMNDYNLSDWENTLRNKFNEEFSGELSLVYIKLIENNEKNTLSINLMVRDALSKEAFPLQTEVDLL